jgi:hypothetical protein
MDRLKSTMLKALRFVRTKLPIICTAVFGLCWLAYLINAEIHGHSFDGAPPAFWNTLEAISNVMLINSLVFVISFSAFMMIKPLPKKLKLLRVFLRLIITLIVSVFFLGCTYLSVGAFYGFGG